MILLSLIVLAAGTRDGEDEKAQQAIQPEAMRERIERHRKGNLQFTILNSQGQPVVGARVLLEQTRHDFLFGCNLFGLQLDKSDATQRAYQDQFSSLFNYATLPFYWSMVEPKSETPNYSRLEAMTTWCHQHKISCKAHTLIWHHMVPAWAPTKGEQVAPLLQTRVKDLITHFGAKIDYWDVMNEVNSTHSVSNGVSDWVDSVGKASAVETALQWASEARGKTPTKLIYNDTRLGPEYVKLLSELQQKAALPDCIGAQSHMHSAQWTMGNTWRTVERLAPFGKPIQFSEITVLSGPLRPWVKDAPLTDDWLTTPELEAKQADYVCQFYTVLFSNPAVEAITWWDLSDLKAWRNAPAGLLRKDMSPKPAYQQLKKLIHQDWWTTSDARSDNKGLCRFRGFYGDYRVTVTFADGSSLVKQVSMPKQSGGLTQTLQLQSK